MRAAGDGRAHFLWG